MTAPGAATRRLVIVGAGVEQVRAYQLARELGIETVGTDRSPDAPALEWADHRVIVDTHDPEANVRALTAFHERHPLHGVMTIAHDVPYTVARVADALDLPGLPLEAARLAQDKLAMKERFAERGVPVPRFREVASAADARACLADWGAPIVTKPIDSCGARGVMYVREGADVDALFAASLAASKRGVVIAEDFVPGLQLSTEGMALDGECHTVSWSERNYDRLEELAPHVIEDGGVLPATLAEDQIAGVKDVLQRAADALGIANGPVKGDLVLGPGGPVVIEIAARLSGGYLCTHQIPWALGVDLVRQTIRMALGETIDPRELAPRRNGYIGVRFFFPEPGVVASVEGFDELGNEPWILERRMYVGPGDLVARTTSHPTRAGFVFTIGATPEEAERRAIECAQRVRITTRPA